MYSHRNCTTKIDCAANPQRQLNLNKVFKFTCNTINMGTKYSQKQPMFNKVGCWLEDIFSVFLSVFYILCVFNILHFYIISFSLLYLKFDMDGQTQRRI